MVRKMRIKFIAIATGALMLLLLSIFTLTNYYMKEVALSQVDEFIADVVDNDGYILDFQMETERNQDDPRMKPDSGRPMAQGEIISGFSVMVKENSNEIEVLTDTANEGVAIEGFVKSVMSKGRLKGNVDVYRYSKVEKDQGYLIVFANTELQNEILSKLLSLSIIIGLTSITALFIGIIILSKYITRPVEIAFDKQKRFIADSSHELKTPLSIMSVNLDMLEMEIGGHRRIQAMSKGIKRMNQLVHELLLLARTEDEHMSFNNFDLSRVMESTILPLEVIAYEHGNEIETTIEEHIVYEGNEEGIRKMIGALMENAIKYAYPNTTIKACLYTKGDTTIFEVFNEGIGVSKDEKGRLFDKFYRVDHSRNRETGGHGIGLSIVKNVVDRHSGKIVVDSIPGVSILFKISL